MRSTYYTQAPAVTIQLGARLGRLLKEGDIVFLFGELGAGKTHFVKGIAEGLGVTDLIKSPTYAYVNTYDLKKGRSLHHYDLYRLEPGDDVTSLGYEETLADPKAINVVEWADRLGDRLPSRYIRVDILMEEDTRSIAIDFVYPTRLRDDMTQSYYEEWQTPLHVRAHSEKVTDVARQIAEVYIQKNQIVDINLIHTACMLHDLCRLCDFREIKKDRFQEGVTDAKWQKWAELRKKYKGVHHADIASDFLKSCGFEETAEVIRLHKSVNIVREFKSYNSLEKWIVYYADKRVKHAEIVNLAERFRDGQARHGILNTPEQQAEFKEVEKRTYDLEKMLFEKLDIGPGDII
ncbi:MAG: tRNA (adenosine(37)-N6)-threonylcarbamoyltransferase complex ATPase subunit type 1 TsaE [Candidatus Peregrinibacteria bacterium]